jgi:hypothetical protein
MSAPTESKAGAAPTRTRRNAANMPPAAHLPLPSFELTTDEMASAVRMFSAFRLTEQEASKRCLTACLNLAEEMAKMRPRHVAPRLRLISGGAK